jgi:NAD(P)H-quinone oxidoreductase subunit 6
MDLTLKDAFFWLFALTTVGFGAMVTFHRSLVHAALGLMGTLLSVGCLYGLLDADFVAVTQVVVYVGGVVILFLFGVFLTRRIEDVTVTNQSVNWWVAVPAGLGLLAVLLYALLSSPIPEATVPGAGPTTAALGDALLGRYLLPFEVISVILLAVLLGALLMARREVKPEERG